MRTSRTRTRALAVTAVAAVAVLTSGCGETSLAESDPDGYQSCTTFAQVAEITDPGQYSLGMINVADLAAVATTDAISDTASPVPGSGGAFSQVDEDALRAACADAGIEVPETAGR